MTANNYLCQQVKMCLLVLPKQLCHGKAYLLPIIMAVFLVCCAGLLPCSSKETHKSVKWQ